MLDQDGNGNCILFLNYERKSQAYNDYNNNFFIYIALTNNLFHGALHGIKVGKSVKSIQFEVTNYQICVMKPFIKLEYCPYSIFIRP